MFCYLAKVETHEESAFILRNTASKCPNVRNADVDVRSPHVDIGSADFYIAGVLRACVVSDDPHARPRRACADPHARLVFGMTMTYEESAFILRTTASKCPNVRSPYVDTYLHIKCRLLSSRRA